MKVEPMKISRYFLFLIFVSAMLGCQKDNTTAVGTRATVNDINAASPETAANAASPETAAVEFVIDVRTQEEWDKGHLKQAIRIPHTEVSERIGEVTEDKSAKLVLY
jgi:predicted sulfurtransferase